MKNFLGKVYRCFKMVISSEGTLFTYSFAFVFLLGIAPLVLIAVLFVGKYFLNTDFVMRMLIDYFPSDVIQSFIDYLQNVTFDNIIASVIMLVVSSFVASNSIYAFMLYDQQRKDEKSNKLIMRLLSMAVLFLMILVGGFSVIFTRIVNQWLLDISWMAQIGVFFVVMLIFYAFLSYKHFTIKHAYKGALVAAMAIKVMGDVFFIIINNFTSYDTIYGPMASIMILLMSCYVLSMIVYIGYCVNEVFD